MNDNEHSRIKRGLSKLKHLKRKDVNSKKPTIEVKKEKEKELTSSVKFLSEADSNVKNFLTNYLTTLMQEDSENLQVDETIKLLRNTMQKKHPIKLMETSDDEKEDSHWFKSKTKNDKKSNKNIIWRKDIINNESKYHRPQTMEAKKTKNKLDKLNRNEKKYSDNKIKLEDKEGKKKLRLKLSDIIIRDENGKEGKFTHKEIKSPKPLTSKYIKDNQIGFFTCNSNYSCKKLSLRRPIFKENRAKGKTVVYNDKYQNDYNDIRNIIPLNRKKYSFSGICNELQQSLNLQPSSLLIDKKATYTSKLTDIRNSFKISSLGKRYLEDSIDKKSLNKLQEFHTMEVKINNKTNLNLIMHLDSSENEEEKKLHELRFRALYKRKQHIYDSLSDDESDEQISEAIYLKPTSSLRIAYDFLLLLLTIYSMFLTPYEIGFISNKEKSFNYFIIPNIFIDAVFVFDIVISFFTAYYNFDEQLITEIHLMALNYLTSWFFLDLLAGVPINSIIEIVKFKKPQNSYEASPLNLLKLLRVVKSFKVFISNSFINKVYFLIDETPLMTWSRLYVTIFIFAFSVHSLACIFTFLGLNNYPNWIVNLGLDLNNKDDIYVASIYFICTTVFSIGYGDVISINEAERIFNIILLVIGIIIYSWSISSLSAYYTENDEKTNEYKKSMAILEEIRVTHDNMPKSLLEKIQRFLLYKLNTDKIDCNAIYEDLPISLKNNLIFEMYKPIIQSFVFFKNFDSIDFILKVITSWRPLNALKNERLVNDGDVIEEIIFVKYGKLSLEYPLPIIITPEMAKSLTKNPTLMIHKTPSIKEKARINLDKTTSKTFGVSDFLLKKDKSKAKTIKEEKHHEISQQYIKLIEIRRNEHFGDVLMFLNKRSPLSVKVTSKITELFVLKRTDAVEISMSFPKIWRQIIKKSLFNMQQINRLINKSLKFFFIHYEGREDTTLFSSTINEGNLARGITTKNTYFNPLGSNLKEILQIKHEESNSIIEKKENVNIDDKAEIKDNNEENEFQNSLIENEKTIKSIMSLKTSEENQSSKGTLRENFRAITLNKNDYINPNDNKPFKNIDIFIKSEKSKKTGEYSFELHNNSSMQLRTYESYSINQEYDKNEKKLKENILYPRELKSDIKSSVMSLFEEETQKIAKDSSGAGLLDFSLDKQQSNTISKQNNKIQRKKDRNESKKRSKISHKSSLKFLNKFNKLTSSLVSLFTIGNHHKHESNKMLSPNLKKSKSIRSECQSREKKSSNTLMPVLSPKKIDSTNVPGFNMDKKRASQMFPVGGLANSLIKQQQLSSVSPRKQPKKPKNIINQISSNIAQNSLNLNNPEYFYSSMLNEVLLKKIERDDDLQTLNCKANELLQLIKNDCKLEEP